MKEMIENYLYIQKSHGMYANPWHFRLSFERRLYGLPLMLFTQGEKIEKPCRQRQSHMQKPNRQFGNISMIDM